MAARWIDEFDQDGRVYALANWVDSYGRIVHEQYWLLAGLVLACSLTYLLLAKERLFVRVSVFAGVMLIAFVSTFVFGSIH